MGAFGQARTVSGLANAGLFQEKMFINGRFVDAESKSTAEVRDPANGALIGTIPLGGAQETQRAIEAAQGAARAWADMPVAERCAVVKKWGELMMQHQEDLAKILTTEQGKPLAEAKGEIAYAAGFLDFFSKHGEGMMRDEEILAATSSAPTVVKAIKMPVGVVGAITPWNFPSAMITRKAGPALVAGCTMVVKPSELTPYSAFALCVLAREAGVPDGVLNVVTGDAAEIGQVLTQSPVVRKITFTGSTRVGKLLLQQSAGTVKRVSMELGGNAPFIVFEDADLDKAVAHAATAKLRNAGQTCVTPNRFLVHASVYDEFAQRLAREFAKARLGHGLAEGTVVGPLINEAAASKVEQQVKDAVSKGATLLTGGQRANDVVPAAASAPAGRAPRVFFTPTVAVNVSTAMQCWKEETFGPLAPIIPFQTEAEAVQLANSTRAGLASYFFTQDKARIDRVLRALDYGMVAANQGSVSHPAAPFGGVKESGIGREGSRYGIDEYISIKGAHDRVA